ncbi:MAG: AIR synthase-related protein, partial [Ferruginibacter sp.]
EIAQDANLGIDIAQNHIPVEEEVYGACEMLGLDPLYVANEGLFVAVVDNAIADKMLYQLQKWEHGEKATIIGEVNKEHVRQVVMKSNIGGRRVVNMLAGEQLPRIC